MIKILGPKKTERVEEEKKNSDNPSDTTETKKITPAQIRLNKDIAQLDLPSNATFKLPNKDDVTKFEVTVKPGEDSYWYGGTYAFSVAVPEDYPQSAPKITCNTKIFHPNIDFKGNVCLNILRQDWRPVLDLNNVILGLLFLFIEPNPNDPLNNEAAELMRTNKKAFAETVTKTLKGQAYKTETFTKMI
mmetsp:Transcript_17552/g.19987  ORF Transcript_17552/g.19987 Transcript_17552/m.19987 type:complete len:189 (+) Transcript_17552:25-591(+)